MKIKLILLLTAASMAADAQPKAQPQTPVAAKEIKKIKIGEKVPDDLAFNHMVNYPGGKAKLSDFRGKVVILDFWNIACGPCIAAFPKMQSLQEQFKDKVQILLVNVINGWEQLEKSGFPHNTRSTIISNTKLPFIIPEKHISQKEISKNYLPLHRLFAHEGEPFHAWIDENGILRATTRPGYKVTAESIQYFLKHKKLEGGGESGTVQDLGMENFENKSILKLKNEIVQGNMLYSSVLFRNLNVGRGMKASLIDSVSGKLIGIRTEGRTIFELYKSSIVTSAQPAESDSIFALFSRNHFVLDIKDPNQYLRPKDPYEEGKWNSQNTYYYETKLPPDRMTADINENRRIIYDVLKSDLERIFGLKSYIETRKALCWVLIRTSTIDKLKTKGESLKKGSKTDGVIAFNSPFSSFLNSFPIYNDSDYPIKPFVNETGFTDSKNVDLILKSKLSDIPNLKRELQKYDLDLVEEEREIKVIVITDKSNTK